MGPLSGSSLRSTLLAMQPLAGGGITGRLDPYRDPKKGRSSPSIRR
jgi:hypothetical protein